MAKIYIFLALSRAFLLSSSARHQRRNVMISLEEQETFVQKLEHIQWILIDFFPSHNAVWYINKIYSLPDSDKLSFSLFLTLSLCLSLRLLCISLLNIAKTPVHIFFFNETFMVSQGKARKKILQMKLNIS